MPRNNRIRIQTNGDLEIKNVRVEDEGFYTCSMSYGSQTKYAQAQLEVNGEWNSINNQIYALKYVYKIDYDLFKKYGIKVPVSFIKTPSDQEVAEGNSVEFYCSVRGKPDPVITWTRYGLILINHK